MKKPKYILDSYALLAYFQAEPAGAKVRTILKEASSGHVAAFMSVISLGEIYYIIARKRGKEKAAEITEDISRLPVDLVDVTTKRVLAAAHVKALHPISYADAFVVATAEEFSATIVTGDPEFKETESSAAVFWL
ncbi:MAG: type II toxin-antitoxin system VapC family toxin [Desulfobacteraceae bacterium]|nr:MAG: type II toxin-antitoxin system VapC family toxin [Desulfobacteraceae bacterium]